jgi:P27 family predicted phage terminase small subunit
MAKRGPKPKPKELKILDGMRSDRINALAPPAVAGDPTPPAHLDDTARIEFVRFVGDLRALGVLSRTDGGAIALYAATYSRWVKAEAAIAERGVFVTTPRGHIAQNPAVIVARDSIEALRRLLSEFGCTPSSRSRVSHGGIPPADDLEVFLKRG